MASTFPQTPPRSLIATLPVASTQRRAAAVSPQPPATTPPIGEALFHDALVREQARADRFDEPFVVARITRGPRRVSAADWDRAMTALSAAVLPDDLIGWCEAGRVLGVIRPAAGHRTADDGEPVAVETMRRELAWSLAADDADFVVTIDLYDPTERVLPEWLLTELSRQRTAMDVARACVKRALDVAGSAVMLVLLAPLMAVVALLVRATSPGPVLFRQERVGAGGRVFSMLKFRTIRADADATLHRQYAARFIEAGAHKPGGDDAVCKIVNDPRVTPVGRVLRRSSIDEVPQFWNVLVGEMSLVGPRPALPYEVACYKTWHRRRMLEVKPGMTGLWQVNGRSRTSFEDMVRLDLRYARNRTILNDLRILLATPRVVVSGRGAH